MNRILITILDKFILTQSSEIVKSSCFNIICGKNTRIILFTKYKRAEPVLLLTDSTLIYVFNRIIVLIQKIFVQKKLDCLFAVLSNYYFFCAFFTFSAKVIFILSPSSVNSAISVLPSAGFSFKMNSDSGFSRYF